MTRDELITTIAEKTQGTAEAPLTRGTIEKVVDATLKEIAASGLPHDPGEKPPEVEAPEPWPGADIGAEIPDPGPDPGPAPSEPEQPDDDTPETPPSPAPG